MRQVNRYLVVGLLFCGLQSSLSLGADTAADDKEKIQVKTAMNKIYAALKSVLPFSLEPNGFARSGNQRQIDQSLKVLAQEAKWVRKHGKMEDEGFMMISESLASDATNAYNHFEHRRYPESQFLIRHITENCVSCHSRLPSDKDAAPSRNFMTDINLDKVPLEQKAMLLVATRQFDEGLNTYEQLFKDPKFYASQTVTLNPFLDYLTVSLRVKTDMERPRKVIEGVIKEQRLPSIIRHDMEGWAQALKDLQKSDIKGKDDLEKARFVMERGKQLMDYPTDRAGVVHYLYASSLLNQFLASKPTDKLKVAEAYYLLGSTELLVGRSYWLSQADRFLEASIRTAPQLPTARKAYALLEENITLGYTGSSGTRIPADVAAKLKELSDLIDKNTM